MRVYLLGFMGSGKSHAGRRLAQRLKVPFVDLDDRVEEKAGRSIADLFRDLGEPAFRDLEASCLRETADLPAAVVATGGGTPCHSDNMAWMLSAGLTIFLDPPVEVLLDRLMPGRRHRPLISHLQTRPKLRSFIESKLADRRPCYQQAAVHVQPSRDDQTADILTRHILDVVGH